jgi:hypothetical protein
MRYLGNITAGQTLNFMFSTSNQSGGAVAPTTPGTVTVYEDNSTTGMTNGVTYTPSFNGVPGVNLVTIATSDAFYAAGHDYTVVLSGAVIDGQTVNAVVAGFSIAFRAATADLITIRGQAVACSRPVTVAASVGFDTIPQQDANGYLKSNLYYWRDQQPAGLVSGNIPGDAQAVQGKATQVKSGALFVSFPQSVATAAVQPDNKPTVDSNGNTWAVDSSGNVLPSKADVQSIQNNTSCVRSVPAMIERPDSGTATYRIELLLYNDAGQMATPDAAPTIALVNQAGTDLSARLDGAAMTFVSTGRYRSIYTASAADAIEQLVWTFSVVTGGATRLYTNTTQVVDTTAVDFTTNDRSKLTDIHNKLPAATPLQDGDGAFKVVDKQSGANLATAAALGTPAGGHTVAADVAVLAAAVGALTAAEREALADAILARDVSHAETTATRCSLATVILAATNKANTIDNPGRLTIYRTDGVTSHAQIPISTDPSANPIDGVG